MKIFEKGPDQEAYLKRLKRECDQYGCKLVAYCFMENHVHLVLIPKDKEALSLAVGRTAWWHCLQYNKVTGHKGTIWGGRFFSATLDDLKYLVSALIYVEMNPVKAKLCSKPADYKWSSARAHTTGYDPHKVLCLEKKVFPWKPKTWRYNLAHKQDPLNIPKELMRLRQGCFQDSVKPKTLTA